MMEVFSPSTKSASPRAAGGSKIDESVQLLHDRSLGLLHFIQKLPCEFKHGHNLFSIPHTAVCKILILFQKQLRFKIFINTLKPKDFIGKICYNCSIIIKKNSMAGIDYQLNINKK